MEYFQGRGGYCIDCMLLFYFFKRGRYHKIAIAVKVGIDHFLEVLVPKQLTIRFKYTVRLCGQLIIEKINSVGSGKNPNAILQCVAVCHPDPYPCRIQLGCGCKKNVLRK